jgi:hypothetical protein
VDLLAQQALREPGCDRRDHALGDLDVSSIEAGAGCPRQVQADQRARVVTERDRHAHHVMDRTRPEEVAVDLRIRETAHVHESLQDDDAVEPDPLARQHAVEHRVGAQVGLGVEAQILGRDPPEAAEPLETSLLVRLVRQAETAAVGAEQGLERVQRGMRELDETVAGEQTMTRLEYRALVDQGHRMHLRRMLGERTRWRQRSPRPIAAVPQTN